MYQKKSHVWGFIHLELVGNKYVFEEVYSFIHRAIQLFQLTTCNITLFILYKKYLPS